MAKFLIACCIFSFITGMYAAQIIQLNRGCTVSFVQGKETHVLLGHSDD